MYTDGRLGNTPRYYYRAQKDSGMLVPPDVLNSTVFLGKPAVENPDDINLQCTGFFFRIPIAVGVPEQTYLVTAKHYADKFEGKRIGVRLNRPGEDAIIVWVDNARWWCHPLEPDCVDAAIMPFDLPEGTAHGAIPSAMVATSEVLQGAMIGPGDEVFMTGLFNRLSGKRSTPIVRTGNIAAMPEERVSGINIGGKQVDAQVYLIEARSMGGLSGSPVFVREPFIFPGHRTTEWNKGQYVHLHLSGPHWFLGLMHGHWTISPSEHNRYDFRTTHKVDESIALGIAVVVPAIKILEILHHPELVEHRKKTAEEHINNKGTTTQD